MAKKNIEVVDEIKEDDTEKTIEEVVDEIMEDVKTKGDVEKVPYNPDLAIGTDLSIEQRVKSLETKVEQLIRGKRPKKQRRSLLERPKKGSCIT